MALDSDLKKFGIIEWDNIWEPGLPFVPGTLDQQDQQILIHGNPDVLWGEITISNGGHTINELRLIFSD